MTDMWTSRSNESYLGVIATYMLSIGESEFDCEYKSRLISMLPCPTPESHDNESIRDALDYVLRETYDCSTGKIFCLVGDNAAVNHSVATNLGVHFMGCCSHKMNLVYKDLLDSIPRLLLLKIKVSAVVSFFHRSHIAVHAAELSRALKTYTKTR